jgi:membrane-bound lytic murein transglycosylase D
MKRFVLPLWWSLTVPCAFAPSAFASGAAPLVRDGLPTRTPETRAFIPAYDHHASVKRWMNYLRGPGHLEFRRWTRKMGYYAALYQKSFTALGLPPELVWLSGMESGCDRHAVSYKGAAGLWQFLPATGRAMGLRVDKWVDERFDPEASTIAAARHLHALYRRFKKWPLVLAAYHAGERWVARGIKRFKTNDYFRLARHGGFQAITNVYVTKALAFIALASNPEEYGVTIRRQPEDLREDLIVLPPGTKLKAVAEAAKIPYPALRQRNPALRRAQTPPSGEPVAVRLPWGAGWRVVANLEGAKPATPKEAMTPIRYKVKSGDTLWGLAKRFGVRIKEVLLMNGIQNARRVRVGQELLLPPAGSASVARRS